MSMERWTPGQAKAVADRVHDAWPRLQAPTEAFLEWLGGCVLDTWAQAELESLRIGELYLCYRCGLGDAKAIGELERAYADVIASTLHRVDGGSLGRDDLRQIVRRHLFTGERPAICGYRGRGALAAWLGVVTLRCALNAVRRKDVTPVMRGGTDAVLNAAAMADLEVDFLRAEYRASFKTSFEAAMKTLDARQRTVLRQHLVEGLTVRQIAALYGVNSSTVARRVVRAREQVAEATREGLQRELQIDDEELDALMGLIRSRVDLSLSRVLGRP